MAKRSLLEALESSLGALGQPHAVRLAGEWTRSSRRTYADQRQDGTASGPFVEVIDLRWQGEFTAVSPVGGLAFLQTADTLFWVKAPQVASTLSVQVSLHAYAEFHQDRATFTGSLAGAALPGVPVSVDNDLATACVIGSSPVETHRILPLARTDSAAMLVLLLDQTLLRMGRKRLWHLRDDLAASLAPNVRELLTRRRTGELPSGPV